MNLGKSSPKVTDYATLHAKTHGIAPRSEELSSEFRARVARELIDKKLYSKAHEVLFQEPANKFADYSYLAKIAQDQESTFIADQASQSVLTHEDQLTDVAKSNRLPSTTPAYLGRLALAFTILVIIILVIVLYSLLKHGGIL